MIKGWSLPLKLSAEARKLKREKKKEEKTALKLFLLVKVGGGREGEGEFPYSFLVKAIPQEPRYVLIQTCNLHTRQFAFMPGANWFGRRGERDKKERERANSRGRAGKYPKWRNKIFAGRFARPHFVVRSRSRRAKTYAAHARVYFAAPARHSIRGGIPYEITRRTANTRGKLMRVFNCGRGESRAKGGHCRLFLSVRKLAYHKLGGRTMSLAEGNCVSCFVGRARCTVEPAA